MTRTIFLNLVVLVGVIGWSPLLYMNGYRAGLEKGRTVGRKEVHMEAVQAGAGRTVINPNTWQIGWQWNAGEQLAQSTTP